MKKLSALVLLLCMVFFNALAQNHSTQSPKKDSAKTIRLPAVVEHGDTIAVYTLQDTKITPPADPDAQEKQKEWDWLLKNVGYYMYQANMVAKKISEIDKEMNALDTRHDRKKYLRQQREKLVKDYSDDLKKNSARQARLLIKLIYRQTGRTTYDLIKEYESGFTAGFWQTMSKLDGLNLKETYDPQQDAMIEAAIKMCGY